MICVGLVLPLTLGSRLARAEKPVDVRFTDIRDTALVMSWTTVTRETGSIRFGPSASTSCDGDSIGHHLKHADVHLNRHIDTNSYPASVSYPA